MVWAIQVPQPSLVLGAPTGPDSQLGRRCISNKNKSKTRQTRSHIHLEPVSGSVVAADRARGLGHVEEARARMLNELVVENLEPDAVTSLDVVGLGATGGCALVASQVVPVVTNPLSRLLPAKANGGLTS
jgi:hypothetical protein